MKAGARFWLIQRVTAIVLLIFVLGFFFLFFFPDGFLYLLLLLLGPDNDRLIIMANFGIASFFIISFYHGMLGIEVIMEDYVSSLKCRRILIIAVKLFTLITSVFTVLTIANLKLF